jgi:PhnB protein
MNDTVTFSERPGLARRNNISPVPKGYHSVTPYLIVKGAAKAIEFYREVLGATELMRFPGPNGTIGHAEIKVGDSQVMLADEVPGKGFSSPETVGGTPVGIVVYVEDVDASVAKAQAAGAKMVKPVQDQFYGDRSGTLTDPFGHLWTIATHIEDVPPAEMQRRMAEMKPCG